MSVTQNTYSTFEDTSNFDTFTLNNAMIKSTDSSDLSDFSEHGLNNNSPAIIDMAYLNATGSDIRFDMSCDFSSQSVIIAGSHKQNIYMGLSDVTDNSVSAISPKSISECCQERSNITTKVSEKNEVRPQITVTNATPPKVPNKITIAKGRNIVSPVAQYVHGKGVINGRKIVYKNI